MDRKQYTAEERNFICMVYQKYKGKQNCYKQMIYEFSEKFPQVKTPSNSGVICIWEKQQKFFTVHNLNSKDSLGGQGQLGLRREPQLLKLSLMVTLSKILLILQ